MTRLRKVTATDEAGPEAPATTTDALSSPGDDGVVMLTVAVAVPPAGIVTWAGLTVPRVW